MSKNNFSKKEWIDLVFENKNKSYGAYQLRLESGNIMLKALFIGIMLVVSLVSVPVIANHFSESEIIADIPNKKPFDNEKVIPVILPEKEKEEKPITSEQKAKQKSAEDITEYTTPKITDKTEVDNELKSVDELEDKKTGNTDVIGSEDGQFDAINPADENVDGNIDGADKGTPEGTGNEVFEIYKLDKKAEFPGGLGNFTKQIKKHFRAPDMDSKSVTVYVSFIVETDGSISDIKILRDPGYGLAQEAIRTLKKIKTKWEPGIYKGKPVRTLYHLPIKVDTR